MLSVYLISDLHLGGAPPRGDFAGFQMCSPRGRRKLAEFIDHIRMRHLVLSPGNAPPVELVINGDFVDFLAEEPFSPLTCDENAARTKLCAVMENYAGVFAALAAFVAAGGRLTLVLGNHDVELSLPEPRRELLERLAPGRHGSIEFIYDAQAVRRGPVLIEHGNRYDAWNAVDHDGLRETRSALSRGETPPQMSPPPGSRLVTEVMNRLKKQYPFIDLLKPETENMLPLLAVLSSEQLGTLEDIAKFARNYIAQSLVRYGRDGQPRDRRLIAADQPAPARLGPMGGVTVPPEGRQDAALARTEQSLALAQRLVSTGASARHIGAGTYSLLRDVWRGMHATERTQKLASLLSAIHQFASHQPKFVQTGWESPEYLNAANAAACRGFKTVIYGHTHLLKRVPLENGGVYINTGTWADLLFIPSEVFSAEASRAQEALGDFADDLFANRLDAWRGIIPSYAHLEIQEDTSHSAALKVFHNRDYQPDVTDSVEIRDLHVRAEA